LPDHASGERPRGSKAAPYLKARLANSIALVLLCHLNWSAERQATMIEKDYLLRLRIEALRVLARTDEPNRAVLIERNIEDYLKTSGSERASLERLRDAIEREDAERRTTVAGSGEQASSSGKLRRA
jgi:RNase P/RNase MRP subunit p30